MNLRLANTSDLPLIYTWFSDPQDAVLAQPYVWSSFDEFRIEYEYVVSSDRHQCYVLEREGRLAAWLEYRGLMPGPGEPSITLWTNQDFRPWIGATAVVLGLDVAFLYLGLRRVWWWVSVTNCPMLRLCHALGLSADGSLNSEANCFTAVDGEIKFGMSSQDYAALQSNALYGRFSAWPISS